MRAPESRSHRSATNGRVDLKEGLGRDPKTLTLVQSTTPGRVFEDLLILGSATNQGYGSAPGDIRAFDVRTGKVVWTFHTIPHPGEFGYDTWPKDAWKTVGGANVWGEFSLDEKRGIVYAPTASAKYNFYGADRKGANLFADCLLALDARTGKRLWHFQMVHHDIWDYDDATAPKLLTVRHDGKNGRRRRAGQQAGLRLGLRPRDRRAAVAHRRAAGADVPTCRARRPGPRSRFLRSRRRLPARNSPWTISART